MTHHSECATCTRTKRVHVTRDGLLSRRRMHAGSGSGGAAWPESDSPLFIEPLCHHSQSAASPLTPSSSQPHRDPSVCHPDADLWLDRRLITAHSCYTIIGGKKKEEKKKKRQEPLVKDGLVIRVNAVLTPPGSQNHNFCEWIYIYRGFSAESFGPKTCSESGWFSPLVRCSNVQSDLKLNVPK